MITKKVLMDAICDLDNDVYELSLRVSKLEKALQPKTAKRKPGRPRKNSK